MNFILSCRHGDMWWRAKPECRPSTVVVPGTCHLAGIRVSRPGRGNKCPGQQHGECTAQGGGSGLPGSHHHHHCRESIYTCIIAALEGSCDMTIIIIYSQHRLTTILDYDRLIVLDQGRIVEDGNPRELQQLEGSVFRGLLEKGASKW